MNSKLLNCCVCIQIQNIPATLLQQSSGKLSLISAFSTSLLDITHFLLCMIYLSTTFMNATKITRESASVCVLPMTFITQLGMTTLVLVHNLWISGWPSSQDVMVTAQFINGLATVEWRI